MQIEEITNRPKRIEGQVRGLQRMVGDERECEALLTQVIAARAALDRAALLVAENYVQECILPAEPELARQRLGRVLDLALARFSVPSADQHTGAQELDEGE